MYVIHTRHVCICIYRRIIRYATDIENNVTRKERRGCGGIRCAGSREGEGGGSPSSLHAGNASPGNGRAESRRERLI